MLTILYKGIGTGVLLLFYIAVAGTARLLPAPQRTKRQASARVSSFFARIFIKLLGIRVHAKHRERFASGDTIRMIVANHLSYLDVLVLSSLTPSIFITSVELKNTLLLGSLARLSGCLFVERRTPSGLKREISAIAHALRAGAQVALFPEGTTSNGDRVHPFKNSLFDAAVEAQADILPVCFRYIAVNDACVDEQNRDRVFYYGSASFLAHFGKLLSLSSVAVEVAPLKAIRAQEHGSRKELAVAAHTAISAAYHE